MAGGSPEGTRPGARPPPHLRSAPIGIPAHRCRRGGIRSNYSPAIYPTRALTRIVVDASVVVAGLFKDGTVRELILNLDDPELCAPAYIRQEAFRQIPRVATRAKLSEPIVRTVLEDLFGAIELIPAGVYSAWMGRALALAKKAAAVEDADYIALALALGAPVWTLDGDLRRVPGLRILATQDVKVLARSE